MPIRGSQVAFEHQDDANKTQSNPVQNTWYTILNTTRNCRIIGITVQIGTTDESLQVQITIDGVTLQNATAACTAGTDYFVYHYIGAAGEVLGLTTTQQRQSMAFLFEGRSVKVEFRKTTAAGTGNLVGSVSYARLS